MRDGGWRMRVVFSMVFALAMILFGAEMFTNAVEWLGRKWSLGQGAVGSILAALGTALPETAVPVTAILFGGGDVQAQEVGIGGILGAPFLLVTLGSLIMALSLLITRRAHHPPTLMVPNRTFQRDMTCFMLGYAVTLVAGAWPTAWLHRTAPIVLVILYAVFFFLTLRDRSGEETDTELHPLYLQWKRTAPSLSAVCLQLFLALAAIVGGAQLLASGVEQVALWLAIPPFALSALLIPLATELPETLNSVVWIRVGKDALAVGNITGAMVFQSTLVPALGIWLTPWNLNTEALFTGALTLAAAGLVFGMFRLNGRLSPAVLIAASLLYWLLPLQTLAARYQMHFLLWIGVCAVSVAFVLTLRRGFSLRSA